MHFGLRCQLGAVSSTPQPLTPEKSVQIYLLNRKDTGCTSQLYRTFWYTYKKNKSLYTAGDGKPALSIKTLTVFDMTVSNPDTPILQVAETSQLINGSLFTIINQCYFMFRLSKCRLQTEFKSIRKCINTQKNLALPIHIWVVPGLSTDLDFGIYDLNFMGFTRSPRRKLGYLKRGHNHIPS